MNKNEKAKAEPQAEIASKKVLDENDCEILLVTVPKKDQNILINSAIDDSTVHSERVTEEQTVKIFKIVESVTNSMREKSKNVIYDQLLSRAFSDHLKSISFSTRIFFNLAQKIEEEILKKTKFNPSLDYELSIESNREAFDRKCFELTSRSGSQYHKTYFGVIYSKFRSRSECFVRNYTQM